MPSLLGAVNLARSSPREIYRRFRDHVLTAVRHDIAVLREQVDSARRESDANQRAMQDAMSADAARLSTALRSAQEELATLRARAHETDQLTRSTIDENHERYAGVQHELQEHGRQLRIRAMSQWVAHMPLGANPLVSVVMATRNRVHLIPRALGSLLNQSHQNWELLAVDDGSTDATADYLASLSDPRIRPLTGAGRGACAARNIGIQAARGSIIAYLDDDNYMHPDWLKLAAWAFDLHPGSDVIYSGFIVDDWKKQHEADGPPDLPRVVFFPYDHSAASKNNVADMGAIAHRSGLSDALFDETIKELGDWDLFLRLTRNKPPLPIPFVALLYTTNAPNRLSGGETHNAETDALRKKHKR